MNYREFLDELQAETLRSGDGDWRLVGNGLLVPHPSPESSEQWERDVSGLHYESYSFESPLHEGLQPRRNDEQRDARES